MLSWAKWVLRYEYISSLKSLIFTKKIRPIAKTLTVFMVAVIIYPCYKFDQFDVVFITTKNSIRLEIFLDFSIQDRNIINYLFYDFLLLNNSLFSQQVAQIPGMCGIISKPVQYLICRSCRILHLLFSLLLVH